MTLPNLPDALLFELFDCAFGVAPSLASEIAIPPPPAAKDLREIEEVLDIRLPALHVELSRRSPYFTRWFLELGPRQLPTRPLLHIIAKNQSLKRDQASDDLILLTHGFDGDCEGFSRHDPDPDAAPIHHFGVDLWGEAKIESRRPVAPDFRTYLQNLCLREVPHIRVKSLRRKAKRLLDAWQEESASGT